MAVREVVGHALARMFFAFCGDAPKRRLALGASQIAGELEIILAHDRHHTNNASATMTTIHPNTYKPFRKVSGYPSDSSS